MAAIEPLGSAMSYTAQQAVKPVETSTSAAETREGKSIEANAPQVDAKTISMNKSQKADTDGKDQQTSQQQMEEKKKQTAANNDSIKKALDELTKMQSNYSTQFGIHEKTNRITVKIVDKKTKEVIKELPPEKTLDMIAKVWEYAGLIVDDKR